jgi:hypothetical protein
MYVYRVFHHTTAQCIFSSAAHETFSELHHILRHKVSLKKYKKIEITPCILSDHNTIKLGLNRKRSGRKYTHNWRFNNTLLNNQWLIEGIKKFLEFNENENTTYQNLWNTAKASLKGKVDNHECIY